jgi:hypothetical protein
MFHLHTFAVEMGLQYISLVIPRNSRSPDTTAWALQALPLRSARMGLWRWQNCTHPTPNHEIDLVLFTKKRCHSITHKESPTEVGRDTKVETEISVRMLCVGLSASLRWVGRYDGQKKASKSVWNVYCNEFCTLELKVQVSKPTKLVAVLCRHSHPIVSY